MPGDAGQADCIMLLSLDKETKEGRILQINRNTMTQIDTYDSTGSAFGTVNAQLATQYAYCIGGSRSCWATEKTVKKPVSYTHLTGKQRCSSVWKIRRWLYFYSSTDMKVRRQKPV